MSASITTPRWTQWLEPWFIAYALAGMLVNGIVPLLIPLTTEKWGDPAVTGLVVAAFYLGQITAPLVGIAADRTGTQRRVFLGSFPVMAAAAMGFGLARTPLWWMLTTLIAGIAAGAVQTTASLFILEGHPRAERYTRIGWFRLAFGLGQVAGLALSAVFAEQNIEIGWYLAAAMIFTGTGFGRIGLPRLSAQEPPERSATATLRSELRGPFGIFLLSWLLAMIALRTVLNVLPLVMRDGLNLRPSHTALFYLVGSLAAALLYPVVGAMATRLGPGRLLALGLSLTLGCFSVMALFWYFDLDGKPVVAAVTLMVIAVARPMKYIGANMSAAELTASGAGSAMGLFNSIVAAGSIIAAVVPVLLVKTAGYGALPALAAAIMALALVVGSPIMLRGNRSPVASAP